jgi:hypothetical protein
MAVRTAARSRRPRQQPPMCSSEIDGSAGLIDKEQFRGIKIELGGEPVPALLQNVRAPLLLGVRGLS